MTSIRRPGSPTCSPASLTRRRASFRSLSETWADTTTPHDRLVLTVLGGVAEFERELIRQRTIEGRVRAKAQARRLGRSPALSPFLQHEARQRVADRESVRAVARSYNVGISDLDDEIPF